METITIKAEKLPISTDDCCSVCQHLDFEPWGHSTCRLKSPNNEWPGEMANAYDFSKMISCEKIEIRENARIVTTLLASLRYYQKENRPIKTGIPVKDIATTDGGRRIRNQLTSEEIDVLCSILQKEIVQIFKKETNSQV